MFDPTLGLYAAVAYADVGLSRLVESVRGHMRSDLSADLFDVHLLIAGFDMQDQRGFPMVPFCPMLTQCWSYLRPRGITLATTIERAGRHLKPALWTTFDADGTRLLLDSQEGLV
jgi:hypothetical protein